MRRRTDPRDAAAERLLRAEASVSAACEAFLSNLAAISEPKRRAALQAEKLACDLHKLLVRHCREAVRPGRGIRA